MDISAVGINLIKSFEGCSLKAYKAVPTEKYYTIGYGHYDSDVKENQVITQEKAEELLKYDLQKFVSGVASLLKVPVNQNQFDALVSFSYNCGLGTLQNSTLLQCINKKDFTSAANEFPKFVHAGGNVLDGLVKRRNAEKGLFGKPMPKVNPIKKIVQKIVKPKAVYCVVVKGDTLSELASKNKTTVANIKKLNNLKSDVIKIGQKLRLK